MRPLPDILSLFTERRAEVHTLFAVGALVPLPPADTGLPYQGMDGRRMNRIQGNLTVYSRKNPVTREREWVPLDFESVETGPIVRNTINTVNKPLISAERCNAQEISQLENRNESRILHGYHPANNQPCRVYTAHSSICVYTFSRYLGNNQIDRPSINSTRRRAWMDELYKKEPEDREMTDEEYMARRRAAARFSRHTATQEELDQREAERHANREAKKKERRERRKEEKEREKQEHMDKEMEE